jgi:hypothetical protein
MKRHIATLIVCLACATPALAGEYSEALGKCLVKSTTQQDRVALVRWFYAAASRHPALKSLANVSEEQLDEASRVTAGLFVNLLTTSCKAEAQKAYREEGPPMLRQSFEVLDKVAGEELMATPEVQASLQTLRKYLDQDKLKVLSVEK